jgi:hypothetical protein
VRINGLLEVIERHEAQFEADMYTELIAQLEDGLEILERSKTETEEEAKNSVITAADVAGGVEGTLSTIGTVTINEETGAIIDIDLSKKPEPIEYPILIDPMPVTDPAFGGGSSQGGTGAGGGVSGSAGMDVDISDDMIEGTFNAGLDATSDLDI